MKVLYHSVVTTPATPSPAWINNHQLTQAWRRGEHTRRSMRMRMRRVVSGETRLCKARWIWKDNRSISRRVLRNLRVRQLRQRYVSEEYVERNSSTERESVLSLWSRKKFAVIPFRKWKSKTASSSGNLVCLNWYIDICKVTWLNEHHWNCCSSSLSLKPS